MLRPSADGLHAGPRGNLLRPDALRGRDYAGRVFARLGGASGEAWAEPCEAKMAKKGKKNLSGQIADLPADNARQWLAKILKILQSPTDGYWRRRLAIGQKPCSTDIALVGDRRAAAIVSNVIIPFALGLHPEKLPLAGIFALLPPEEDNAIIRQSAFNLIGPDHNPALYRNGLLQQGLIQIFHDYCLNDRSNCAECGLANAISGMKKEEI